MLTLKEIRKANKELRLKDDSHLWPICGRFNATEKAIRQFRRRGYEANSVYEYKEVINNLISIIVNSEV